MRHHLESNFAPKISIYRRIIKGTWIGQNILKLLANAFFFKLSFFLCCSRLLGDLHIATQNYLFYHVYARFNNQTQVMKTNMV